MSSSRIQKLAECPFGYFLRDVLEIESPTSRSAIRTRWLDPLALGKLAPRGLSPLPPGARAERASGRPWPRDRPRIEAIADEEIREWRERVPPRSELAFRNGRDEILFACRTFLQLEEIALPRRHAAVFRGRVRPFARRSRFGALEPGSRRDRARSGPVLSPSRLDRPGRRGRGRPLPRLGLQDRRPRVPIKEDSDSPRRAADAARALFARARVARWRAPGCGGSGRPGRILLSRAPRTGRAVRVPDSPSGDPAPARHPLRSARRGPVPPHRRTRTTATSASSSRFCGEARSARRPQSSQKIAASVDPAAETRCWTAMREKKDPPRLADDPAATRIRTALDETLLVEAAAGTGKTTSLVDRMVALVGAGTRSSGSRRHVHDQGRGAARPEIPERARGRGAGRSGPGAGGGSTDALASLDACFIGTIHAFCSRLLRERPVEAGLDPGFEEMDEAVGPKRARRGVEALRRAALHRGELDPRAARRASACEWDDLEPTFNDLCENDDVDAGRRRTRCLHPISPPRGAPCRGVTSTRVMPELPATRPAGGMGQAAERAPAGGPAPAHPRRALPPDGRHPPRSWTARNGGRPRRSGRARLASVALLAEHEEFRQEVVAPALRRWRGVPASDRDVAAPPGRGVLPRRGGARTAGRSFQDLLALARDLLREHPAVRRDLQQRFPRAARGRVPGHRSDPGRGASST